MAQGRTEAAACVGDGCALRVSSGSISFPFVVGRADLLEVEQRTGERHEVPG